MSILKPVILWIHGGSLMLGAGHMGPTTHYQVEPDGLVVEHDIIAVTINYRLGPLGFLYSGKDNNFAPGNMGIRDQIAALKWIKEHIESFGGDPNEVTIIGQSAGAWSVGIHLLSPASRNLFKNAIMMSSSPIFSQIGEAPEVGLRKSLSLAALAGCGSIDDREFSSDMMSCLQEINSSKLIRAMLSPKLKSDLIDYGINHNRR